MAASLTDRRQAYCGRLADQWNDAHPVGTPVIVRLLGKDIRTRTSSAAWTFNGRPLVSCKHLSEAVDVRGLTPRYECWVRLNRRGMKNHWVHGVWDSEASCLADLQTVCREDDRIGSYDIRTDQPDAATE